MTTKETGELTSRVALVTGGVRRIGLAIALELAKRGATVVVNARSSRDEAAEAVRTIEAVGGTARAMLADVTDEKAVAGMSVSSPSAAPSSRNPAISPGRLNSRLLNSRRNRSRLRTCCRSSAT